MKQQGKDQKKQKINMVKIKGVYQKIKIWFITLSFWKKILIIFTLNAFILLLLTDVIMLTLFGKISDNLVNTTQQQKTGFNKLYTSQITSSSSKIILSNIEYTSNILSKLINNYNFYNQNPDVYEDLQANGTVAIQNVSAFQNASYNEPAIYYYNNQSTFISLPYLHELLPILIRSPNNQKIIQRINVYVLNSTNTNDLTIRTIPAINTFNVSASIQNILERFVNIDNNSFVLSIPYLDEYTTDINKSNLIALRSLISTNTSYQVFLQVQLNSKLFFQNAEEKYFYDSSNMAIVGKINNAYVFYGQQISQPIKSNIQNFYNLGYNENNLNGQRYISYSLGISNNYIFGQSHNITNMQEDHLRCIGIIKSHYIEQPSLQIQTFVNNESNILKAIIFSWSFVILLSTIALATVVGNYIFFNLKMLSSKMNQYITDPSKFHLILIELKELELKGILKKLSDNLIGIIQKIQVRKKERKDRINPNYHPLSVGQPKFQQRQQLNDYQILEQIRQQIKQKLQKNKKQAQQAKQASQISQGQKAIKQNNISSKKEQ